MPDPTSVDGLTSILTEEAWSVDDVEGWLDALGDSVLVGEPLATVVGGLDATRVEIRVGEPGCGRAGGCEFTALGLESGASSLFVEGSINAVWFVDQGAEDPLVVVSAIASPDDRAWFDITDEFLSFVELSNVGPNSQRLVLNSAVELVAFGGVTAQTPNLDFELYEEPGGPTTFWNAEINTSIHLLTNPLTRDGSPLTTTCLLYTSPSPRDATLSRMPSSA